MNESRSRVPSFYVLDIIRAIEGRIPPAKSIADRAFESGGSTLAWPAPSDAAVAIDEFEHDLATMRGLLGNRSDTARGRALSL